MYGSEKSIVEKKPLRKIAYRLFGEVHVTGRIRGEHVIREIGKMKRFHNRPILALDAGTGRGDLAFYLVRKYHHWRITGLELEEEKTRLATQATKALGLQNLKFISGEITRQGGLFDSGDHAKTQRYRLQRNPVHSDFWPVWNSSLRSLIPHWRQ